jgi:hypothetical protein
VSPRPEARGHFRPLRRPSGPDRRRRVLHLFVEGEVTEATYADRINEHFGRERRFHLKVHERRTAGKPRELVDAAISLRIEELPRVRERRDPRREPEVWCLFDRDEHGEVDTAVAEAIRNGVQVAFSHPCFELWLLLHFQPFAAQLNGRCADLTSKLRQQHRFERFDKHVGEMEWAALDGRFDDARTRALQLVAQCPSGGCGPEEHGPHCVPTKRDPSTDVWKLLDSLRLRY